MIGSLNRRIVSTERGKEFAKAKGFEYFETSAKDYVNVDELFLEMSKVVLSRIDTGVMPVEGEPGIKVGDLETSRQTPKSIPLLNRVGEQRCCGLY